MLHLVLLNIIQNSRGAARSARSFSTLVGRDKTVEVEAKNATLMHKVRSVLAEGKEEKSGA
ncbi:MAG: hypothetical protein A2505_06035 [Deltaproteobacteria bacterium RIFOXYD12_FULL_55_16]|nr:MAG: hypothetical protein A2505_06035 [Deltaproteobacteria bacterium RIFOXYD12_FULL_55_16]